MGRRYPWPNREVKQTLKYDKIIGPYATHKSPEKEME